MAENIIRTLPVKPKIIYIPDRPLDSQVASQLEFLARLMDSVFRVPGSEIRFGLDSLIGLIPGFGDTATSLVSLYILSAASRYRVPRVMLMRMALNIAIAYGENIPPNGKCLIFRGLHRGAKSVFGRLKIAAVCSMLLISSLISLRNAA